MTSCAFILSPAKASALAGMLFEDAWVLPGRQALLMTVGRRIRSDTFRYLDTLGLVEPVEPDSDGAAFWQITERGRAVLDRHREALDEAARAHRLALARKVVLRGKSRGGSTG